MSRVEMFDLFVSDARVYNLWMLEIKRYIKQEDHHIYQNINKKSLRRLVVQCYEDYQNIADIHLGSKVYLINDIINYLKGNQKTKPIRYTVVQHYYIDRDINNPEVFDLCSEDDYLVDEVGLNDIVISSPEALEVIQEVFQTNISLIQSAIDRGELQDMLSDSE